MPTCRLRPSCKGSSRLRFLELAVEQALEPVQGPELELVVLVVPEVVPELVGPGQAASSDVRPRRYPPDGIYKAYRPSICYGSTSTCSLRRCCKGSSRLRLRPS